MHRKNGLQESVDEKASALAPLECADKEHRRLRTLGHRPGSEDGVVHAETLTRLPDAEPAPESDAAADEPPASEVFETPTKPTIPPGTIAL